MYTSSFKETKKKVTEILGSLVPLHKAVDNTYNEPSSKFKKNQNHIDSFLRSNA